MQPITQTLLDGVAGDAIRICETPALTGHERRRAELVQGKLHDLGWTTERDQTGNVVAYWGERPRSPLAVLAHLDTVHTQRDIRVTKEGNILRGPGVVDNSLGVAGLLYLARVFRQTQSELLLVATVGEEGIGNLRGALAVVENWQPREVIALEGTGQGALVVAGPGSARYQVTITGPGGHSWVDKDMASATHVLVELLGRLESETDCESWNIGTLQGGGVVSARAGRASAEIEFRDHQSENLQMAEALLMKMIADVPSSLQVAVECLGSRPGGRTELEHPLIQTALQYRQQHGLSCELASVSTDANAGYGSDIPAICFGLAHGENLHTLQEWCSLEGLDQSLDCLADIVAARATSLA